MKLVLLAARNSIHTVRWSNALAARGHEMHLLSSHRGGDPLDGQVQVHMLPFPARAGYFLNVPWVRRQLRKIGPDLLHAHYASGYGTLGRLTGFRPYVLSVWGSDVYDYPEKSKINRLLIAANLRAADCVCSTSRIMSKRTRTLCAQIKQISITPFGIDVEAFQPKPERKDPGAIVVGTVKTLAPKYAVDILIRAFAEAREQLTRTAPDHAERLRLLIVGDGPQRQTLEELARELAVAGVTTFAGGVPHAAVPNYLNRLYAYVAVSRFESESFGVAVLEASACGLPVVVSDVGGLPEVVVDGETGFVVRREDVPATAAAIVRLIREPALRARMGDAGRKHVLAHYDWERSVDQMEEVYVQVRGST